MRSRAQMRALWPDLQFRILRGGAERAMEIHMRRTEIDGLVLPASVTEHLGIQGIVAEIFSPEFILPGPGQGIQVIVGHAGDHEARELLADLHSPATAAELAAEHAFCRRMVSDQDLPVGALARVTGGIIAITGTTGRGASRITVDGGIEQAEAVGDGLASQILSSAESFADLLEADFPDGLPEDEDGDEGGDPRRGRWRTWTNWTSWSGWPTWRNWRATAAAAKEAVAGGHRGRPDEDLDDDLDDDSTTIWTMSWATSTEDEPERLTVPYAPWPAPGTQGRGDPRRRERVAHLGRAHLHRHGAEGEELQRVVGGRRCRRPPPPARPRCCTISIHLGQGDGQHSRPRVAAEASGQHRPAAGQVHVQTDHGVDGRHGVGAGVGGRPGQGGDVRGVGGELGQQGPVRQVRPRRGHAGGHGVRIGAEVVAALGHVGAAQVQLHAVPVAAAGGRRRADARPSAELRPAGWRPG